MTARRGLIKDRGAVRRRTKRSERKRRSRVVEVRLVLGPSIEVPRHHNVPLEASLRTAFDFNELLGVLALNCGKKGVETKAFSPAFESGNVANAIEPINVVGVSRSTRGPS